jgi:hypothetical protein
VSGRWSARGLVAGLGLLSLIGYAAGFRRVAVLGEGAHQAYVGLFAALFLVYLVTAWLVCRRASDDRILLALILGFGLAFRVTMLPTPVLLSSDPYRYLWDGRVQRAGVNPYRYAPAAPELAPLRDAEVHPLINRPAKRTIYPPGAEAAFALVAAIAPSSMVAWRLFILACEVATGALLLLLLRRLAMPASRVVLYAWTPLAVFEGVQAAHVDVVFLPALLLALAWRQGGSMGIAGAALGAAILIKLYPAALLLAWRRRGEWRFPLACAVVVAAGYLPYGVGVGTGVLGFLPEYFGSGEDFNVGLRFFLTEAIGLGGEVARGTVMLLLFCALAVVLAWIGRGLEESPAGVCRAGMAAVSAYLVLVPTAMHPWYVLWMLPFLTVRVSFAWLWFSGAVSLSYLKYHWDPAGFPLWLRVVEFFPLYALLAWEWTRRDAVRAPGLSATVSQRAS